MSKAHDALRNPSVMRQRLTSADETLRFIGELAEIDYDDARGLAETEQMVECLEVLLACHKIQRFLDSYEADLRIMNEGR